MKNYTDIEKAVLILDSIKGLEYKYKRILLDKFSAEKIIGFDREVSAFAAKLLEGDARLNTLKQAFSPTYADSVFEFLQRSSVTAVTYKSENYPKELKEISSCPLTLYCKGNIELLKGLKFSIVGSRKTLPYAVNITKEIACALAKSGVTVVTGSAVGGDRAALLGAIDSGNAISVIAHGHNKIDDSNRDLLEKVIKNGLVISEFSPDTETRAWMYPVRNRIIAALSVGTLIVSGEKKSGARYTADYALEFNKDVYAIPYSLGIASGQLCNELIKNGAILCDGADCILENLNIPNIQQNKTVKLDGQEKIIHDAIGDGCDTVDKIIAKTGMKIFEIAPILSSLELSGIIVKLLGNKYKTLK